MNLIKFKLPNGIIGFYQLLIISNVLLLFLWGARTIIDSTISETITIWGTSIISNPLDPGNPVRFNYEFGAGNYGAIKPLFIIGLILTFLFSSSLYNPGRDIPLFKKRNW